VWSVGVVCRWRSMKQWCVGSIQTLMTTLLIYRLSSLSCALLSCRQRTFSTQSVVTS